PRLEGRRQVQVRDAEVGQVRNELARLAEAEVLVEHQAVGRPEIGHFARLSSMIERAITGTSVRAGATSSPGSADGSALVRTSSQLAPKRRVGSVKVTSSWWALNSIRNESSSSRSPRGPGAAISCPLRNIPTVRCSFQSRLVMRR